MPVSIGTIPFLLKPDRFFMFSKKQANWRIPKKNRGFQKQDFGRIPMFGEMERGIDGRISFVADSKGKLDFFDGKAYIN